MGPPWLVGSYGALPFPSSCTALCDAIWSRVKIIGLSQVAIVSYRLHCYGRQAQTSVLAPGRGHEVGDWRRKFAPGRRVPVNRIGVTSRRFSPAITFRALDEQVPSVWREDDADLQVAC